METLPYPSTSNNRAFCSSGIALTLVPKGRLFTQEQCEAGKIKRQEKIAHWATLPLRQDFVDASFMRGVLKAAGLHSPPVGEPASTKRIRQRLRTIGIENLEITDAVGTTVCKFLVLNPNLPLWAALSAILEATGRYDKKAVKFAEQEDMLAAVSETI